MTAHISTLPDDLPNDDGQSLEGGSSTGGSNDGYVTPDEFVEDEHDTSSDAVMQQALCEADEVKAEGTEYFRTGQWVQALQSYRRGLARLPPRKGLPRVEIRKGKSKAERDIDGDPYGPSADSDDADNVEQQSTPPRDLEPTLLSKLEQDCAKARSVLNGNIGACHVKLGEHKEAVEACSQALLDDPHYIKALHRRALSNDLLGTWSSLTSAEEDYNELLKILPPDSSLLPQIRASLRRVAPRREAAQKAEMGEMMDKLKGLGNSLLGNFGLSTDNFKFEPNGQGGYSVNFAQ